MKDLNILDQIIVGRVEPHIYAFTTNTIPNYLKVGDTYRPINVRLNEWKEYYPNLKKEFEEKALVNDDVFFRDYAIHQFLEHDLHKERINPQQFPNEIYISNEFFKDTKVIDVENAIEDIKKSYEENLMKYKYYDANTSLRTIEQYISTGYWNPRPNQKEVISNFKNALEKGRTNLLMYAVMRFGKSFTSMCCAVEMGASIVVIVSAKADVKEEWKKTIQSADNFREYRFLTSYDLQDENAIKKVLSSGNKVAIFLTLQDLQGNNIKEKHKELFNNKIDLLLIDETHFGARAEKYGAVLRNLPRDVQENREDGYIDVDEASEQLKVLNAKVKIHLSGTPYRILMGSEFEKDDIIAFCQFTDIVEAQEMWDKEHLSKEEFNEWDNPYYGFPQMIRFAFNPNASVRRKLEELKENGISYAFSELFRPLSIQKDSNNNHKKFKYEKEVLDLLEVIDGSKSDENVLGFLDYEKIKKGNMCRHIVMVLPYCASCDSIEQLIADNKDKFKNLNEYEIINISGVDKTNEYKKVIDIKNKIKECEKNNQKTLTLTVNRMLTGSTVEEWDTMIYLKDTSSPQEYDQAIFRLQNQYTKDYLSEDGDQIKYNKKPQTLLVDFDPNRMFIMQETKSLIYNANVDKSGNSKLQQRLENELRISPIIVFNKDKVKQITAIDIMKYVSNYSNSRGVLDEANDIPIDLSLLNIEAIKNVIIQQAQLGSRSGLQLNNTDEDSDDNYFEQLNIDFSNLEELSHNQNHQNHSDDKVNQEEIDYKNIVNVLTKKFRTYYARLLFFSFLTSSKVNSLEDIINVTDNEENLRIFNNLGLDKKILSLMQKHIDPFKLSQLDYKIQNINALSIDPNMSEIERALVCINKFTKLSVSEIVTPQKTSDEMLSSFGISKLLNIVNNGGRILDIASKEGEFSLSLYRMLRENNVEHDKIMKSIFAIPTSSVAYEFTRKIFEILGLDINNIATKFNSYDLLKIKNGDDLNYDLLKSILEQDIKFSKIDLNNEVLKEGNKMKFDAIIGNPPYQETISNDESNASLGKQLFPYFIMTAIKMNPDYVSMITPSRWFAGDAQDKSFVKLRDFIRVNNHISKITNYINCNDVFENVVIKGGVNYFLYENEYSGMVDFSTFKDGKMTTQTRNLFEDGMDIIISDVNDAAIINKVVTDNFVPLTEITTGRNAFDIIGKQSVVDSISVKDYKDGLSKLQCKNEEIRWIDPTIVIKNRDIFEKYKVFISKSAGDPSKDAKVIGKPYVGEPYSACTDSLIPVGKFDTKEEAENLQKYFKTKFLRYLVSILKVSQNVTQIVYKFVPMQDYTSKSDINWNKSIKEIDKQLYEKYKLSKEEIENIEEKIKEVE